MQIGDCLFLTRETILEDGEAYLVRYRVIDTPWFGIYLHHILRSDQQRDLHDHPWWFVSALLWGEYREHHAGDWPGFVDRRAPSICFRRAKHAHRLQLNNPCWTLVLRGPRWRKWGFFTRHGWVRSGEYLRGEAEVKRTVAP